ncbi:MAG: hypothetical protein HYU52_12195 [Acidobacteria bacterium]|nr:hypothetical protein [Acidobacteriota bacterium]
MTRPAWRLAVIAVVALAPFLPMLVRGEVPAFRDHRDYFIPLREATAEALRSHELPLWNALSGSGEPWLANPQTGVFYPPAWIPAVLPFEIGYVLFLALHLAIAGWGWRRLMMRWTGDSVATLSACALMLSGPMLSLLDVSNSLGTFAWIPLLLSFALEGRQDRGAARDAITIALCFLGGEPLLALIAAILYSGIRLLREGVAAARPVAGVAIVSFLLCGVQLLPFVESLRDSDRSAGLEATSSLAHSLAPVDWLRMAVSPMAPGDRSVAMGSQQFLPSIYVTPLLALLPFAVPLLWHRGRLPRRACAGLLLLLVASAFLAAGSSMALSSRVYMLLGLAVNRYPVKLALFGVLALVALGTICLDRLLDSPRRDACWAIAGVAFAATIPFLAAVSAGGHAATLLAGWVVLLAIAVIARPPRVWVVAVLALAVCADSIASSRFLLGSRPHTSSITPHAELMRRDRKVARLEQLDVLIDPAASRASRESWLGGYLNLRNGQPDAMTAAPVVDAHYLVLLDYALSRPRLDILDVIGVGYLLTMRQFDAPGFRQIGERDGVRIYERDAAFPPVTIWESHAVARDRDDAFALLWGESWNATTRIVVTGSAPAPLHAAAAGPVGTGRVVATTWRSLSVSVESPRGGIAVVTQRAAPGWRVVVDGSPREALLVDGVFRGVAVPAGRHTVVWSYEPRSFVAGAALSFTGAAIIAGALIRRRRTRRA